MYKLANCGEGCFFICRRRFFEKVWQNTFGRKLQNEGQFTEPLVTQVIFSDCLCPNISYNPPRDST